MSTRSSSPPETTSKPQPFLRQQAQDAEIGIGFDGIADGVRDVPKGTIERGVALANRCRGINIERRAVLLGQLRKGTLSTVQDELSAAAQDSALRLAIRQIRGTSCGRSLTTGWSFLLGRGVCAALPGSRPRSGRQMFPRPPSAQPTALNSEFTTQSADCRGAFGNDFLDSPASEEFALAVARVENAVAEEHEHIAGLHAET